RTPYHASCPRCCGRGLPYSGSLCATRLRLSVEPGMCIMRGMLPTQNLHVKAATRLLTPRALKAELPLGEVANRTVVESRESIRRILRQQDARLLLVVGPCSIHDVQGALEYGRRLSALRDELKERMEIVMRVYFEKPRTTIGWKGLI